jgi:ATP-dependent Clp endopeptidase proteolytic subunit ClpP
VLLCGGTKGKRYALPNSNIMIHQLLGGAEGPASDVEIRVRYMLKLKQRLNSIIAKHSGRSLEQVEKTPTAIISCRPKRPRPTGWWMRSCSPARKFPV